MRTVTLGLVLLTAAFLHVPAKAHALTLKAAGSAGYEAAVQSSKVSSRYSIQPFTGNKLTVNSATPSTIFLFKQGRAFGPVVFGYKASGKIYSYAQARKAGICKKASTKAVVAVKPGKLGKKAIGLTIKDTLGMAYLAAAPAVSAVDSSSLAKVDALCVPLGAHHRLGLPGARAKARSFAVRAAGGCGDAGSNDKDHDSVPDTFDADNDNNGMIDNFFRAAISMLNTFH